jgi:hypothetical protein
MEMRPGASTAKAKSFYLSLDTLIDGLGSPVTMSREKHQNRT